MSEYKYSNIEFENEGVKKWWRPQIDKKKLKELHKKRNFPAFINTAVYFVTLFLLAYFAYLSWGTIYSIPAFLIFGTFYSFTNARWHEYGHKTFLKQNY